jgi:transposase-like protein
VPSEASGDLAGCGGRLISIGIDTATAAEIAATPNLQQSHLKEVGELPTRVVVRSSKYLNNLIEQDHRRIKQRLRPMLGLKSVETAAIVISGIELPEKIKKGQFKIGKLGGRRAMPQEIWQAALAA